MKKIITNIAESGLKLNKVINVIKTFELPRLDYSMMDSVVSLGELNKVDQLIRKEINKLIRGPPLSKDMFNSSWKYGGYAIKNMRERYSAFIINNLADFSLRDEDTRRFVKWQLDREAEIRNVSKSHDK